MLGRIQETRAAATREQDHHPVLDCDHRVGSNHYNHTENQIKTAYFEGNPAKQSFDIPVISISAKNGQGIKELENTLKEMFYHGNISFNSEVYITNVRHKKALEHIQQLYEQYGIIDNKLIEILDGNYE